MKKEKIAILGLGIEGVALYDFFDKDRTSIAILDRSSEEDLLKNPSPELRDKISAILADKRISKKFGADYLDGLDYDTIYRSPGIDFKDDNLLRAKADGIKVSSQIALFFQLCPCRIIGVTGTKGKGTTSSLIYSILKKSFQGSPSATQPNVYLAGNIGYPAVTLIPDLKKEDIVVLELSNFQLADLGQSPSIAVITNLGVDHLDYHRDEEEYWDTKKNILKWQDRNDSAVLNMNSTFPADFISEIRSSIYYFSNADKESKAYIGTDESVYLNHNDKVVKVCDAGELNLVGRHNLENIAAASIVADLLDVDIEVIRQAVKEFTPLPHRLELVEEIDGVKYINDSFATNPGPTIAAIKSFKENKVLILGGSSKGADFGELAQLISKSSVSAVVLIGDEAEKIEAALKMAGYKGMLYEAGYSFMDAIKLAKIEAKPGDYVVLSPACASFDMFKNYKERGEKFREAIREIK